MKKTDIDLRSLKQAESVISLKAYNTALIDAYVRMKSIAMFWRVIAIGAIAGGLAYVSAIQVKEYRQVRSAAMDLLLSSNPLR